MEERRKNRAFSPEHSIFQSIKKLDHLKHQFFLERSRSTTKTHNHLTQLTSFIHYHQSVMDIFPRYQRSDGLMTITKVYNINRMMMENHFLSCIKPFSPQLSLSPKMSPHFERAAPKRNSALNMDIKTGT